MVGHFTRRPKYLLDHISDIIRGITMNIHTWGPTLMPHKGLGSRISFILDLGPRIKATLCEDTSLTQPISANIREISINVRSRDAIFMP